MRLSLNDLLRYLDQQCGRVPLDELLGRLRQTELSLDDVRPYVRFADSNYQRNSVRESPWYQALVLCWASGQASPIHDHSGSSCAVRVLEGRATETLYRSEPDGVRIQTSRWTVGAVIGSEDRDIHKVANREQGGLVTLHIYSPPLLRMGKYDLVGDRLVPLVPLAVTV